MQEYSPFLSRLEPESYQRTICLMMGRSGGTFRRAREPAVEAPAFRRHLFQQAVRTEASSMLLRQLPCKRNEHVDAHAVDVGQRAPGVRGKAEAEDGADVGLARISDHAFFDGAR